jgi:hypothetical protein
VAAWLHRLHGEHGVATVHGAVASFRDTGRGIDANLSRDGSRHHFDAAVLAVGLAPETGLAQAAGLKVTRGIVVDHRQRTSNPAVLAVGDAAVGPSAHRSEHWEAARNDGARAAAAILGSDPPAVTAPWFWTDRYGVHVEVVGGLGDAGELVSRGVFGKVPFSVFGVNDGRVVGAVSVGDSMATRAARRMIDRGLQPNLAQLADPRTDIRKLVRR